MPALSSRAGVSGCLLPSQHTVRYRRLFGIGEITYPGPRVPGPRVADERNAARVRRPGCPVTRALDDPAVGQQQAVDPDRAVQDVVDGQRQRREGDVPGRF